jgi:hypothetical protein
MSIRRQIAVKPSAFNKVMAGLEDVRAYLDGERKGFAVRAVQVPKPMSRPSIVQEELGRSQTDPHD